MSRGRSGYESVQTGPWIRLGGAVGWAGERRCHVGTLLLGAVEKEALQLGLGEGELLALL
eukprot:5132565-Prymnesium_polylepis.1